MKALLGKSGVRAGASSPILLKGKESDGSSDGVLMEWMCGVRERREECWGDGRGKRTGSDGDEGIGVMGMKQIDTFFLTECNRPSNVL